VSVAFGQGVETAGVWSVIGRRNPIAKLVITAVITVALLLSLDRTTAGLILIAELVALPFVGLRWRTVVRRVAVLVGLAAMLTAVNALFSGNEDGLVLFAWGPFALSSGGLAAASAVGMRVLALSLPAVLLLSTTDPVLIADGVQQQWKVPPRFAMSSVVGLRLLPLLASDWSEMSAARRARGLTATGPITAVRSGLSRLVGLLVVALRRSLRMATAMSARGFDPYAPRTFARESRLGASDWVAMAIGLALAVAASYVAFVQGVWQFSLVWPTG